MRRVSLLALALVALALLVVTRAKFRPERPAPPRVRSTTLPPAVGSAPAPAPIPAPTPELAPNAPESGTTRAAGWLKVQIDPGGAEATGRYKVVVFSQEGPIDKSEELPGAAAITVGPVPTGKKAVFVIPGSPSLGAAVALATVVENGEADVHLRLPKAQGLNGVVVDNTGRPVTGISVDLEEPFPLEFRTAVLGQSSMESGGMGTGGGGGMKTGWKGRTSHYSFGMLRSGIDFSFGGGTDSDGRFTMPYGTTQTTVTLKIRRNQKLIQEESVLVSEAPLRLMIPMQGEEPKK